MKVNFFWRHIGSVFKRKNIEKFLNSRQLLCQYTTSCNINSHKNFLVFLLVTNYYSDMLFRLFHINNYIFAKYKTFCSTGFENKSEFFGTEMAAF